MKQSAMLRAYKNHVARCRNKKDALGNQVEMRMTFDEWSKVWEDSGHWAERGNRAGQYCMSRYQDIGHYEVGNVFIQLHADNSSQIDRSCLNYSEFNVRAMLGKKHSPSTLEKMSVKLKGSKNPNSVLDEDKVRNIKLLLASNVERQTIADMYGVTKMTISAIATGRNWKHVTV